jgi:ABC-type transport system substrate-binding protein
MRYRYGFLRSIALLRQKKMAGDMKQGAGAMAKLGAWFGSLLLCCLASCAMAANPANPNKVLRTAFQAGDDGFDMVRTTNYYSGWIADAIFETLISYDYLARPLKLVPKTAERVPEATDGGKSYTFQIKKGIYFSPDPVFNGARRELTAEDFAYTIKRAMDPTLRSPVISFIEGKIVGLDAVAAAAKKTGHFDYDAKVAGLQVLDRYTLKITLNRVDYNFLNYLAVPCFAAVPREAVEKYGAQFAQHPVGTGPYRLQQYVPRSKIVLEANPEYRGFVWDFAASEPADQALIQQMKGKKMPQIGRIEVSIIEEEQPRWLSFQEQRIDIDMLPQTMSPSVLDGDHLKPEFVKRGVKLSRFVEPEITYTLFNMRDPMVGGYTPEKIALRRAVAMAYSVSEEIARLRQGQAVQAHMIVPPGVGGHEPGYRSSMTYDIALANKLLDRFGYKRAADGFRTLPDGKPLLLEIRGQQSSQDKIFAEIWKRGLDPIGVRANHHFSAFADNYKAAKECKLMMWGGAWLPDIPDGENFLQLLYGPNAASANYACYQSKAYDAMYEKAINLPFGPERYQLYQQMSRQMEADTPWALHVARIRNWVSQPWVLGFKKHPVLHSTWQFMDIEAH